MNHTFAPGVKKTPGAAIEKMNYLTNQQSPVVTLRQGDLTVHIYRVAVF